MSVQELKDRIEKLRGALTMLVSSGRCDRVRDGWLPCRTHSPQEVQCARCQAALVLEETGHPSTGPSKADLREAERWAATIANQANNILLPHIEKLKARVETLEAERDTYKELLERIATYPGTVTVRRPAVDPTIAEWCRRAIAVRRTEGGEHG